MKLSIVILNLFLLFSCASRPVKLEKPFYWVAKKGDREIRMFGTIHVNKGDFELPKFIKDDVFTADVVFVEVNQWDINRYNNALEPIIKQYYEDCFVLAAKPYQNLAHKLTSSSLPNVKYLVNHDATKAYLKKYNINVPVENISPYLVNELYYHFVHKEKDFSVIHPKLLRKYRDNFYAMTKYERLLDSRVVIDDNFQDWGIGAEIAVRSLDDVDYLINNSKELYESKSNIEAMALKTIEFKLGDQGFMAVERFENLIDNYILGDSNLVLKDSSSALMTADQKEFYFIKRNKNWMKKISKTPHNKIFVAAGLLHFIGPENLINSLRQDGYAVERKLVP